MGCSVFVSIAAAYPVEAQVSVHNLAHPGLTADKNVKDVSITQTPCEVAAELTISVFHVQNLHLDAPKWENHPKPRVNN